MEGRRPVLVVSSQFHIDLTPETVVTVLPFTSRERRTWLHLLHREPLSILAESEVDLVRPILRRMLAI